ncbi:MFS transporter [Barrientosiimonas endolithica]|uniref:Major facilitator superfamily (MFS) profile domain-containing protein n=1 Tax=Barrientosiimonas endolithica TaxID=1535208 RepID=A0ABM8HAJ2_9MICO|nr:hypothetical protein GCM10025872_16110 [Barrientosiimonas endolithica]
MARAAQGIFAGAGTIVGRAMIRDLLDASAAQRLLSQVTMVFGAAPAVAPIVGGLLVPYGWRTIFWFLAALGAGLALAATFGLRESLPEQDRQPFRAGTVIRSVARRYRDLPTTVLAVATGLNFGAMFLYISSAPAIVEGLLGRGEQDYWVLFVPMIGGLVVGSYVAGRLGGRTTRAASRRWASRSASSRASATWCTPRWPATSPSPGPSWARASPRSASRSPSR